MNWIPASEPPPVVAGEWCSRSERVLVWIDDNNFKGIAFGNYYGGALDRFTAEGFSGDWRISHWHPLPGAPK